MGTIERELIETLKAASEKFQNDPKIKEFEKASAEFKEMVRQGLIKERGYNLLSIEDFHLTDVRINTTAP